MSVGPPRQEGGNTAGKPWFRRWSRVPRAAYRLVCFPHAGGSASFFREWADGLPEAEVLAVCYPGRAERIGEPLAEDLPMLARDIAGALGEFADLPLTLFGHSMGAPIALETARALEASGVPVAHLFASGSRDAPLPEAAQEPDEEQVVVEELLSMGGTSHDMMDDALFRELVLPYVMGDARLYHGYRMPAQPLLRCPVTVVTGDRDENTDRRPWTSLTTASVAQVTVPGGHFYLTEEPPHELLRAAMSAAGQTGTGVPTAIDGSRS
ncbi:thioesterase II family protein [Streptomyces sp. NEAU-Y11]|uniref:thioesterase II family protein n=1 Tax=Streptomyces cucumeris TaxID=2962890 RepID=UPI0020C92B93|nr:alpha/beta fold hydrolase [Streptomyces sp. NEAU-Y11]MCP9211496.1 alpha/beta fold hydrolase [Streptomyces sp. NEAU-Y11]